MDKTFYNKYINILIKLTRNINNWYLNTKLHQKDIETFCELIILFLYKISLYIEIYDYHYIITLIYFKRFILSQSEKNPFIIFIISFIYCIKFWEEQDYYIQCIYDFLKEYQLNIFEYEFEIIQFSLSLHIDYDTYQQYYNFVF
jgi:hypothetical protein